ncbi:NAD-dependent epimerase/dehydratase family protein [Streptomyces misionensis]|uniref:NAD-dependent epimerase/dehydratase family protein n=1 Tax=Streptomyces misionensis TaxID=67331 RepID=A0A5C6IVN3_9ACTN|nr:NAD(P)H-binding protein [Streptomyces misionensis]TWV32592.1 NAD-dependent epimerase/dehydratase family protein [Streptomyces misionensis]
MGAIIVFGAGGRVGRAAVDEARRCGHRVTAVVRTPAGHPALTGAGVRLLAGDVTDADTVAALAAGQDAAVMAAHDPGARADVFFPAAARALLDGLGRARVGRLVAVGLSAALETSEGTLLMDTPGFPREYRAFSAGHAAGTAVLRACAGPPDWVVVSPAGDFDPAGARTGGYGLSGADPAARVSFGDFAIALLDEIDAPRHHRVQTSVVGA